MPRSPHPVGNASTTVRGVLMQIGTSLFLLAVGAILSFAVQDLQET